MLIPYVFSKKKNLCKRKRKKTKQVSDLVRVIWKVLYPAMKEASLVRDCFPEPPTPTSRALPRGVRMMRDTFTRCIMASLKKTRSMPDPRMPSLYCWRNICNLSSSTSKLGICNRPTNCTGPCNSLYDN